MTTIEEAAHRYVDEIYAHADLTDLDSATEKNNDLIVCMAFGNDLMKLPLASRLTDAERELVVNTYNKTREWLNLPQEYYNNGIKLVATALQTIFEEIFGKELFEKEG